MVYRGRDQNEEETDKNMDEVHPLLEKKIKTTTTTVNVVTDAFPFLLSSSLKSLIVHFPCGNTNTKSSFTATTDMIITSTY